MLFTLVVQLIIMRRFEKFLGWFRIIVIYTICGMAANVFSGIFLPYFVTVHAVHTLFVLAPNVGSILHGSSKPTSNCTMFNKQSLYKRKFSLSRRLRPFAMLQSPAIVTAARPRTMGHDVPYSGR